MTKMFAGSILDVPVLTESERVKARDALAWLENDLIRRRRRLAYWTMRKAQADTMPGISEDLRRRTLHFHDRASALVASGEKLRVYLTVEFQEQPEHLPAYHYAH